jgi:hypothetical protein
VLARARETLLSPRPKPKRLKPSPELLERIDRAFINYPWRAGGLYAWRSGEGDWTALAATEAAPLTLGRHYVSTPGGYAPAPRPKLTQAILILLEYRGEAPPAAEQARGLKPWLRPWTPTERDTVLKGIDGARAVWAKSARRDFEEFTRDTRDMLGHFTPAMLRDRYAVVTARAAEQAARLADRQAAADRHFQMRFKIDPRDVAPADRLVDLGVEAKFNIEPPRDTWTWSEFDAELEKARR